MNRTKIIQCFIELLEAEHKKTSNIAQNMHESVISGDNKQESKYDTRKIEESYLVGAQKKRVKEIEIDLNLLKNLNHLEATKTVTVGSIIKLLSNNKNFYYLLVPGAGGYNIRNNEKKINALSVHSPIGSESINLEVSDSFELETPLGLKEYKILEII